MTHARVWARALLLVGILAASLPGLATPANANHSCYPNKCEGGDARLGSISVQNQLYAGKESFARVNGRNIGRGSDVSASLSTSNGSTSPFISHRVHTGPDQPFSIYFKVKPATAGTARLRGCASARPEDFNRSNDCGSTRVSVKQAGK